MSQRDRNANPSGPSKFTLVGGAFALLAIAVVAYGQIGRAHV